MTFVQAVGVLLLVVLWLVRPSTWKADGSYGIPELDAAEDAEAEVGWTVLFGAGLVFVVWPWL